MMRPRQSRAPIMEGRSKANNDRRRRIASVRSSNWGNQLTVHRFRATSSFVVSVLFALRFPLVIPKEGFDYTTVLSPLCSLFHSLHFGAKIISKNWTRQHYTKIFIGLWRNFKILKYHQHLFRIALGSLGLIAIFALHAYGILPKPFANWLISVVTYTPIAYTGVFFGYSCYRVRKTPEEDE